VERHVTGPVRVVADAAALQTTAADIIARAIVEAVQARGSCSLVLAGGSTPKGVYAALATIAPDGIAVPWGRVHVFWGDERHVPPDHADSNYRMAHEALLSKVPVPAAQIHRIHGEDPDPKAAAAHYADDIRATLGPDDGAPSFDVVLLGLGADGHTASLFPGTAALLPDVSWVTAVWVETLTTWRITMSLPLLNAARLVIGLVSGSEKAAAVRDVLQPGPTTPWLPARYVQPVSGRLQWLLDRPAAALLDTPLPPSP
jgi:6-phosphogluconolactonase